jgi:threonine/homoserine/homoserine lactone efflux protein
VQSLYQPKNPMTLEQTLPFLIFSLVAAITPGPSNVMITATGSAAGIVRGLPCVVGAAAGMATLLFTAALGLGQLILGHPEILRVMNWCGAAFLLWFAWKIANAGRAGESAQVKPVGFFGAAFFQWVNPKGWLVAVGAAGTYLQPDAGSQLLQALVFAALFFSVALPSGFVWLVLGASMQGLLRNERTARVFNIAMALALAASVAMILR